MSKDTIRRYSDSGVLRTFRTPGNQRRFRPSDVRQLLTPSASAVSSPNEAAGVPEAVAS